tara:strand:- start:2249 stop:5014 length:2766 start_codon:yes stop_codon:yes gene_type:complete
MPESLSQQRIADQYTSLLHVSGASIASWDFSSIGKGKEKANVYDGAGNVTGISLSSADDRVIINNYIEPEGWSYKKEWLDAFFPINSVILTTNFQNPMFRISGTRWVLESQGIFPVGVGTGTDKNNDSFTFTAGNKERHILNLSNGDIAGEFRSTMDVEDLPLHRHTTDTQTEIIPEQRDGEGTNVGFVFYFGDVINPRQLVRDDERYLDADAIEAFEYNTTYGNTSHYRDFLIRENHRNGKVYTDADFNPRFANQTLQGWAPPQAGGAGWGGILNTSGKFIGSSPRPVGVRWEFQGTVYYIARSFYDPRSNDRVHPGRFSDRELIKARDFIIHTLGITEAAKALAGVDRLIELGATVEQAYGGDNTYFGQIPMNKIVESSTTGQYVRHNNIPPNFPIYLWRRVPLDYVENIPPIDRPGTNLPMQFVITSNKKSTKNDVFNLNQWAADKGWNGQARCKIIIDEGVYIYSDDPNDDKVPAMIIDEFPGGLELVNKGFIMGRGGNGGTHYRPDKSGQSGGDAIHVIGNSEITIDNTDGGIGGGGGGGAPAWKPGAGVQSGGGGGAGGGWGGTSEIFIPGRPYHSDDGDGSIAGWMESPGVIIPATGGGGNGGEPGQPGGHGRWYGKFPSHYSLQQFKARGDIVTVGWGPRAIILPGVGGEAGGSGAGGIRHSGRDSQGTGGGGGRILTATAYGGGTGGVLGAPFGALDINGNIRTTGPSWSNTPPANNGSVRVQETPRPGRSRPLITETYITAYNSSQPYKGWNSGYKLRSNKGRGNGSQWAVGPHWRANGFNGTTGIPSIVARVNNAGRGYHTSQKVTTYLNYNGFSYLSPTGWSGDIHYSALIRGGSGNSPGIADSDPISVGGGKYSAGGGGWGAPGGSHVINGPSYNGGAGGLTVKAAAGSVTIIGGLVYGETEGNVNIR